MQKPQYHILNGDALKTQLPTELEGEIIVTRECLIDGNLAGNDLDTFFANRAAFIAQTYEGFSEADYHKGSVGEFERMKHIPPAADINLWFEHDLFCQANFWFVVHFLELVGNTNPVFLVIPEQLTPHGFGDLSPEGLLHCFQNKRLLSSSDRQQISQLWQHYQKGDLASLQAQAQKLVSKYSFIAKAVEVHITRIPTPNNLGRPINILITLVEELGTTDFRKIFPAFIQREYIYGFGDLQVKELLKETLTHLDK